MAHDSAALAAWLEDSFKKKEQNLMYFKEHGVE
jgi:hypothetical protein